jgi:hypothetical protein
MSRTLRIHITSYLALLVTVLPALEAIDSEDLQYLTALNVYDSSSAS